MLLLPLVCCDGLPVLSHAVAATQQSHSIAKKQVTHISGPELSRYYVKIYQAKDRKPAARVADKWEMYTGYNTTVVKDEVGRWWWVVIYSSDDIKQVRSFVRNFPSIRAKYPDQSAFTPYIYENPNYVAKAVDTPKPIEQRTVPKTIVEEKKPATTPAVTVARQVSDVDKDIPVSQTSQENTFAVIIANEDYNREVKVPYALNDGTMFKAYCQRTLGIPASNIHMTSNATLNDLKYQIDWLRQVMEAYDGEARILFYYAGHGIPDEASHSAYLLPVDGYASNTTTGYSLNELYSTLSQLPCKSALVLLDACFSGAKRDGGMLASARGVAIKVKENKPAGNLVVFSAAQGDETAYPYQEQQHGMFTYYLLKTLKESKGNITLGDLSTKVTKEVKKRSVVQNEKMQTPTVISSPATATQWKSWKLK